MSALLGLTALGLFLFWALPAFVLVVWPAAYSFVGSCGKKYNLSKLLEKVLSKALVTGHHGLVIQGFKL